MTSNNKATRLLFETKKSPPLLGPVEIYGSKQQVRAISLRTTRTVSLEIDLGVQRGEEEDSPFPFMASVEVRSNTPLTVTRLLLLSQKGERKGKGGKRNKKKKRRAGEFVFQKIKNECYLPLFDLGAHLSAHLSCLGIVFFLERGGGGSDLKCLAADGGKHETDPTQPKKRSTFFPAPILISLFSGERASGPPSFITPVRPKNKPTDGYETTYRERDGGRTGARRQEREGWRWRWDGKTFSAYFAHGTNTTRVRTSNLGPSSVLPPLLTVSKLMGIVPILILSVVPIGILF